MSKKSVDILSSTYKKYLEEDYKQLAAYLIQRFDWSSDNSVALFRRRLKQGIDNYGVTEPGFVFPALALESAFNMLDKNMRKYK